MAEERGKDRREVAPEEASQVIKRLAERQRVRIELTEEQLQAILKQWDDRNPREPAEITFFVGDRDHIQLKVAGYRYRGDTCCV